MLLHALAKKITAVSIVSEENALVRLVGIFIEGMRSVEVHEGVPIGTNKQVLHGDFKIYEHLVLEQRNNIFNLFMRMEVIFNYEIHFVLPNLV